MSISYSAWKWGALGYWKVVNVSVSAKITYKGIIDLCTIAIAIIYVTCAYGTCYDNQTMAVFYMKNNRKKR